MKAKKHPVTQAVRVLRAAGVAFEGRLYDYVDHGGSERFASETGIDEHLVIKTLILEDDAGSPLIALMHGDREVSTRALARAIGARHIELCEPQQAERHSGYKVGGTSPFGTRKPMPVYCQRSIADLPEIYINGGKRGYLVRLASADLLRITGATLVDMAQD